MICYSRVISVIDLLSILENIKRKSLYTYWIFLIQQNCIAKILWPGSTAQATMMSALKQLKRQAGKTPKEENNDLFGLQPPVCLVKGLFLTQEQKYPFNLLLFRYTLLHMGLVSGETAMLLQISTLLCEIIARVEYSQVVGMPDMYAV